MSMNLSNGFKKYAKNTGYLLFGKIIKLFVTFTVGVYLIRYLGPTQFGLFSYAISFVFLFSGLANLGLDSIIVRNLVRKEGDNEILGSAFLLKLIGTLFAIIIILITINVISLDLYTKGIICIVSLGMLFQSFNVIDFYFQSKVLSRYVVYAQVFSLVITSILYLSFIYLRLPLIYFAYVVFFETLITSIGLIICYKLNKQKVILWKINLDRMKGLLKDSWPLIIGGIAVSIYMRIDQVMIKQMLNITAVGYYSAAVRIGELFYVIPTILAISLFPAIINAKSRDEKLYYDRLQKLFGLLFWIAVSIAIFMTIIAKPLINILYGQEYSAAAGVLSLYIWAGIFVFLGAGRAKWMISEDLQRYTMIYTIGGAVVNVSLNMFLIPICGIKGAAIATIISQFVATVLSGLFSKKTRKIFFLQLNSINFVRLCKAKIC